MTFDNSDAAAALVFVGKLVRREGGCRRTDDRRGNIVMRIKEPGWNGMGEHNRMLKAKRGDDSVINSRVTMGMTGEARGVSGAITKR
jgi:hypothetical protein